MLNWNFQKGRDVIIYTTDGWNTYKEIFSSEQDPNLKFGRGYYTRLNVAADKSDTLISFLESEEQLLYLSKNNFKTFNNIDFSNANVIRQIYTPNAKTIYLLIDVFEKDPNTSTFLRNEFIKSTNYGNNWELICKSKEGDLIHSFEMLDENNITFKGYFHSNDKITYCSFWYTTDGCKTFNYLFEPNIIAYSIERKYLNNTFKYSYANKDQLICLRNNISSEKPHYDNNLSYYNQINEFYEKNLYIPKYDYYCSSRITDLKPPSIRFNDFLSSKYNFGSDTLYWDPIPLANSYRIKYYGIANASKTTTMKASKYLSAMNFVTLSTDIIDTVVSDTFLIINNLKKNYRYFFWAYSQNELHKSVETLLESSCSDSSYLDTPTICFPDNLVSVNLQDNKINFIWKKVQSADSYNITLYDANRKRLEYASLGSLRVLFNIQDYKDTTFVYDKFDFKKNYLFTVTAQNKDGISYYSSSEFYILESNNINSKELIGLRIFPNPALSTTRISLLQEGNISINAVDMLGRSLPLWSGFATAGEMELDVTSLPTGTYTLLINYRTKVEAIKLIKN